MFPFFLGNFLFHPWEQKFFLYPILRVLKFHQGAHRYRLFSFILLEIGQIILILRHKSIPNLEELSSGYFSDDFFDYFLIYFSAPFQNSQSINAWPLGLIFHAPKSLSGFHFVTLGRTAFRFQITILAFSIFIPSFSHSTDFFIWGLVSLSGSLTLWFAFF